MGVLTVERPAPSPRTWHWTRETYHRLIELGIIGNDDKVELIDGQLVVEGMTDKTGQSGTHRLAVRLLQSVLAAVFGIDHVCVQLPLPVADDGEPEPDAAVVREAPRDERADEPVQAMLVVEVSDTTLRYDRTLKASLYASVGIAEYWIVNLVDRVLEVHRQPAPDAATPAGVRYGTILRLAPGEIVSPLAAPEKTVKVADLLP